MDDPHALTRFVEAQAGAYQAAKEELRGGQKLSHWMWFMFPQVAGLGSSPTAQRYAIGSKAEAQAYLDHPLLGARLTELTNLVLGHGDADIQQIFGHIDAMKFRSSMTLFDGICPEAGIFQRAIDLFYGGEADAFTLEWLTRNNESSI